MDWARDQLGHLIDAAGKGLFSYGLNCPTCAEPVFRRAGSQRRAHFAHYSFGAKPGCELYRPVFAADALLPHVSRERSVVRSIGSRGGLFLGPRAGGGYQLRLRMPRLETAADVTGQVRIQSALGGKYFAAGNLLSKQFVSLPPAVPLVEVSGSDMLATVAESIRQDVTQFREAGNFFRSVEDGGRLLAVSEPLELGERYCLLGRQALSIAPLDVDVRITGQSEMRGWHFCEIELPRGRLESARELADAIGRQLGRLVRPAGVRVWPIDPPPHHIEDDGTLVYPTGTQRIAVRRSGDCEVLISGSGQADRMARVYWSGDEWGEIVGVGLGEWSLFQGNQEQFCVRVEACECFAPIGIQVDTAQGGWDFFDARANDAALNAVALKLRLVCPNERVLARVPIDLKVWERSGEILTFIGTEGFGRIDAGGFGVLQGRELPKPLDGPRAVDPKQLWIEGVMARLGDPTMVAMLPWRNAPDGRGPLKLPDLEELSWLGIHVRAATGR